MIKEYERVVTLVDKTEAGKCYPKGTIGVIVSLYSNGNACEVEIWDDTGYPINVVTYETNEVKVIPSK